MNDTFYPLIYYYEYNMRNFIREISKKILAKRKEKALKILKESGTTFSNQTGKTIISSTETVKLNSKTLQIVEEVKEAVKNINKTSNNNPEKLIDYIRAEGTRVYKLHNASKILEKINEHTGFLCEMQGIKGLYVNIITGTGLSLNSKPLFIISSNKKTDYYALLREFYLWYSMKKSLPGFEFKTQEKFKKYIRNMNNPDIKQLSYGDMLSIQEAINRDKEANEFVMDIIREKEGSAQILGNIQKGGANI